MNRFRETLSVFLAAVWIGLSEFFRNDVLLKSLWMEHYEKMRLLFPASPVNGVVWCVWSLLFAVAIYVVGRRFALWQTTLLSWLFAFVLMWLVVGNLDVLPLQTLLYAVPLSLLETFVAVVVVTKSPIFLERIARKSR